jgi:hypothetical protein
MMYRQEPIIGDCGAALHQAPLSGNQEFRFPGMQP